jgi:hypothetical protein
MRSACKPVLSAQDGHAEYIPRVRALRPPDSAVGRGVVSASLTLQSPGQSPGGPTQRGGAGDPPTARPRPRTVPRSTCSSAASRARRRNLFPFVEQQQSQPELLLLVPSGHGPCGFETLAPCGNAGNAAECGAAQCDRWRKMGRGMAFTTPTSPKTTGGHRAAGRNQRRYRLAEPWGRREAPQHKRHGGATIVRRTAAPPPAVALSYANAASDGQGEGLAPTRQAAALVIRW